MFRSLIAILVLLIFSTLRAQNFGVNFDIGTGQTNKIFEPYELTPKTYLGLGGYFYKPFSESKWGAKAVLDFNKRTLGGFFEQPINDPQLGDVYYENKYTHAAFSLTFAPLPCFNISNKIRIFLGPEISFTLFDRIKIKERLYETKDKENELSLKETNISNEIAFGGRWAYGARLGGEITLLNNIDLGIRYQYTALFEYDEAAFKPFYNILVFSLAYNFK